MLLMPLKSYGTNITIYDPWANEEEVMHEYGLNHQKKYLIRNLMQLF